MALIYVAYAILTAIKLIYHDHCYTRVNTKKKFAVGIGASGGGIGALTEFFKCVSGVENIAFIVITHIKRDHASNLDRILERQTHMPVIRVTSDMEIKPGHVYVLIENTFMTIEGQRLVLRDRKKEEIVNRAVDIFFRSLAESFGAKAVGIVLSGGGNDGLAGVKAIEDAGGYVMVQTPDSSQFSGMPLSVIDGDNPHIVASPNQLAEKLKDWINR